MTYATIITGLFAGLIASFATYPFSIVVGVSIILAYMFGCAVNVAYDKDS